MVYASGCAGFGKGSRICGIEDLDIEEVDVAQVDIFKTDGEWSAFKRHAEAPSVPRLATNLRLDFLTKTRQAAWVPWP
jgi:hypothetical protein